MAPLMHVVLPQEPAALPIATFQMHTTAYSMLRLSMTLTKIIIYHTMALKDKKELVAVH